MEVQYDLRASLAHQGVHGAFLHATLGMGKARSFGRANHAPHVIEYLIAEARHHVVLDGRVGGIVCGVGSILIVGQLLLITNLGRLISLRLSP